jgi:hypothetical protein
MSSDLLIDSLNSVYKNDSVRVLGKVTNTSQRNLSNIVIVCTAYLNDQIVAVQESLDIFGDVFPPNATHPFQIEFYEEELDRYEVTARWRYE